MGKKVDISGRRFGRLTAVRSVGLNPSRKLLWECLCDCGERPTVVGSNLRNGTTKSCGCWKSERTRETKFIHGRNTSDPTYMSWSAMIWRCRKRRVYIDRGITVCPEWANNFMAFLRDMGERPAGKTLDRADNDDGYHPGNCRWATPAQQAANTTRNRIITFNGESLMITEWEKRLDFGQAVVVKRLRRGWSVERALTTPSLRSAVA